ncbi:MAG: hypothetical protein B7Y39_05105 [Bdellovibrio sp. 28-41-41]|nr:MAG: hypothetical protein B7Y39_05105 [Bdellovibrio sp. 28-41-41]
MKLLTLVLSSLVYSVLTLAQTPSIEQIENSLNDTQWVGGAGIGKLRTGGPALYIKAEMAFQVDNGHLYYLSSILGGLDKKIDSRAKGLCINSPPREAQLVVSEDGKSIDGNVVLPDYNVETGTHTYYTIPLKNLKIVDEKNLIFTSIPVNIKGNPINVRYKLSRKQSKTTDELAAQLKNCLIEKPWIK